MSKDTEQVYDSPSYIVCSAGEMEQVMGMEYGVDDYMVKPFHWEVLHAKIKALLRRSYGNFSDLS